MRLQAFGHAQFDRASIPDSLGDLSTWPSVDETALSAADRETFTARRQAIQLFIEQPTMPVAEIQRRTGIHSRALYRHLERCWSKHDDGRMYGFRGVIPYARLKQYERSQFPSSTRERGGLTGAFSQLLQRYPNVETTLRRIAKKRGKKSNGKQENGKTFSRIHKAFLEACREGGVKLTEYPFTQSRLASRSLSTYMRKISQESFQDAAAVAGATKVKRAFSDKGAQAPAATKAFEVVEFDGHKIDLRVAVRINDPFGLETLVETTRIWVLILLDIATRAILGYSLALGKEYNKDDVAAALQNALTPFRPKEYKLPGLAIRRGGGFPSGVIPETEYACWDWFRFDGARCHLADDTLERLTQIVGCWPDNGPAGQPDDRPFVERFFRLVGEHFAHRLPGTTGSDPKAIERLLNDPGSDISLLVELEELEEMIEVFLADYNGEAHGGIGGRTPLEAMQFHVRAQSGFLRTLPKALRSSLCLLQEARITTVRGNPKKGIRPHINFCNVRYTSSVLSNNPELIGKKVRFYFDVRDIRFVRAFFEDGSELGTLMAARPWCITPHSLRVRQEIFRLKHEGKLVYGELDDPVAAWYKYKRAQAKTNKRAAGAIAKHQRQVAQTEALPVVETSLAATTGPAPTSLPSAAKPSDTPQPKPLHIKRTFTF